MIEIIGKLNGVSIDCATGKPVVSFSAEDKSILQFTEKLTDRRLRIDISQYRERRTLDQNSYYWTLVAQLADVLGVSKPFMHNQLLRSYGQYVTHDGRTIAHIVRDDMGDYYDEAEHIHLKPTSHTKTMENGEVYRLYHELRGSSDLNTKEMATLLDGTIEECKAQGIQTATPEELARMRALC